MMNRDKLGLLRKVLFIKALLTVFFWGLPTLLGPPSLLAFFNLQMPDDPLFLRLFGAIVVAVGILYWFGYQDPRRNVAIVKFGIVDNGLATLTVIVLGLTSGISSWVIWFSSVLTALFFVAFIVLIPKDVTNAVNQ